MYPWTTAPLIVSAPMHPMAQAPLATAVSLAGGIGFLAAGLDASVINSSLSHAAKLLNHPDASSSPLPVGVGFVLWGSDVTSAAEVVRKFVPAAVWLFSPRQTADLVIWTEKMREASDGKTQIWIQLGSVAAAVEAASLCKPDVIVVQGADAGGHGLARGAGITSLVPEVADTLAREGYGHIPLLAAGGISDGRCVAAALTLGASGAVLGTRFLASKEAEIKPEHAEEVLRTSDGGVSTVRTTVFDAVRGTTGWPAEYDGRGIANLSVEDAEKGVDVDENKRLFEEAAAKGDGEWGKQGRKNVYAGTGVGLVREIKSAAEIVEGLRRDSIAILEQTRARF
jgi:nitronate monooxygenase